MVWGSDYGWISAVVQTSVDIPALSETGVILTEDRAIHTAGLW